MTNITRIAFWLGGSVAALAIAVPAHAQQHAQQHSTQGVAPEISQSATQTAQYMVSSTSPSMTSRAASPADVAMTVDTASSRIITGRVIDSFNQASLPYVRIDIDGVETNVHTNRDGQFFVRGVKPGSHTLEIRALGYIQRSINITVAPRPVTTLDLWLNRTLDRLN